MIHEHTTATALEKDGSGVRVRTTRGGVRAVHVALGMNVFPNLVRPTSRDLRGPGRTLLRNVPATAQHAVQPHVGGAIDTCTRFSPFFGTALGGRVAYALGYAGMGVGASRFGARVMLDKLAGTRTERTQLALTQRKPVPFPPEPLKWAGITLTKRSLAYADEHGGARNLWLRSLDRFGVGFDS